MRGKDIYTLVFRVFGIYLIYDTIVWVTQAIALLSPTGFRAFGSAAAWVALPAVVFLLGAYIFIRFAPRFAAWLSGEEGEETIGLNLGAREFFALVLFGIGLYLAVTAAAGLLGQLRRQAGRFGYLARSVLIRDGAQLLLGLAIMGQRQLIAWGRSFWRFLQTTRRGVSEDGGYDDNSGMNQGGHR